MSATARAARTSPSRRPAAAAPVRRRPVLTQVPPAPATVAGRGVFAVVVLAMLLTGMAVLLVLNTSLAQGAFELSALTRTHNQLSVQEQQLLQQVALEESPDALQARASELGMVPVAAPVFLRLSDGAVLGTPTPAVGVARPRPAVLPPDLAATAAAAAAGATGAAGPVSSGGTTTAPSTSTDAASTTNASRTKAAAKPATTSSKPKGDAAVADPAPQSDAAVADTTPAGHR